VKKVSTIIIFVGIIGILGFSFIPGIIDKYQSKKAAVNVLDNVIDQEYEKAFESVYYYDLASDLQPTISYEDAKSRWIKRVKLVKEKGVYLVDYNQLHIRLNDTYPEGTVHLIIMENGKKVMKENVYLWFGRSEDGWKLGNFSYRNDDVEEDWEKALSGRMKIVVDR